MSKRDKWGAFMLAFTVVMTIAGLATGIEGSQIPGFLFGCAIVYWMGTGFFKDDPMPQEKAEPPSTQR